MKKTIKIASVLLPCRGNSWDFENPKEVVYAVVFNPTKDEEEEAVVYAEEQYNLMGWQKCFVEPPKVIIL